MIDYSALPYIIEPMQERDIEQVMEIEGEAFSAPWTTSAYRHELRHNEMAHYLVLRERGENDTPVRAPQHVASPGARRSLWRNWLGGSQSPAAPATPSLPPVLGYGGFWLMAGEAHISTIAIRREWRGKHLGELLLVGMIEEALELRAQVVTLEVRVSNKVAQNLYRKYGFMQVGERKHYYSDNGENAYIMTTDPIDSETFQKNYRHHKQVLLSVSLL